MGCTRHPMTQVKLFSLPLASVLVLGADQKKSGLWDEIGIFLSQFLISSRVRVRSPLTKNAPALGTRLAINSFVNVQSATKMQLFLLLTFL